MCGRFTITADPKKLAKRFDAIPPDEPLLPHFNAAPTQDLPVILNEGSRRIELLRWGLIPSWAKEAAIGNRMINARAESLEDKPSFRDALNRRRCLVLADGFYEWKKEGGAKRPLRITLRSGKPFAFAGLWERWRDPQGKDVRSFTIITTEPNELLAPIHNRMPAMLAPQDERGWLANDLNVEDWIAMLRPYPAGELTAYAVSKRVNSAANDDPSVIEPATDSGDLPGLR